VAVTDPATTRRIKGRVYAPLRIRRERHSHVTLLPNDQSSAASATTTSAAAICWASTCADATTSTIPCAAATTFAEYRVGSDPDNHGSSQLATTNP
jgi:hypothetical protein